MCIVVVVVIIIIIFFFLFFFFLFFFFFFFFFFFLMSSFFSIAFFCISLLLLLISFCYFSIHDKRLDYLNDNLYKIYITFQLGLTIIIDMEGVGLEWLWLPGRWPNPLISHTSKYPKMCECVAIQGHNGRIIGLIDYRLHASRLNVTSGIVDVLAMVVRYVWDGGA